MPGMRYVYNSMKSKRYRFPTHTNDLVIDRSESEASEVFIVVLEPGEAPPMHQHDDTEQVFYILEGRGRLEAGAPAQSAAVKPGDVVRIPPRTPHRIHCEGDEPLRYLAVDCFPAGRPPHEPTWESHVRVVCKQQGWAFESVVT
jgi:quercetin dioxygenase-like cupin family protein